MTEYATLKFRLQVEDDWPPFGVEALPARHVGGDYALEKPPLYVKNLSVGDVVEVEFDVEGYVQTWRHRAKSQNSTIWLLRIGANADQEIDAVLARLRALGCNTVSMHQMGSHSVDVGADIDLSAVDAALADIREDRVALAFPSLRHASSDE